MLEAAGLGVTLGSRQILSDVSFSLRRGTFTALLGRNGSGKSTLAACLRQELRYTGQLTLAGRPVASFSPRELSQRIASLPQSLPCPPVTVEELADFGRSPYLGLHRARASADRDAMEHALTRTGMLPLRSRMLPTLSGGERQRAFLAMTLAQDTELLVLDEPTTHLDLDAEAAFLRLLRELRQEGKTLLVILHNLSLAVKYADALVILDEGRCVCAAPTAECLAGGILESVFHVRRVTAGGEPFFLPY